jgi:hypothetical protein
LLGLLPSSAAETERGVIVDAMEFPFSAIESLDPENSVEPFDSDLVDIRTAGIIESTNGDEVRDAAFVISQDKVYSEDVTVS